MSKLSKRIEKINKVIVYLTLSDVFSWGTYTIITAFTGLYLSQKLNKDAVQYVAIGTSIYFFTRAIFQIPIGKITDKLKGDKDEILLLTLGILLMGFPFLFYSQISAPIHYFVLQFVFGLGTALDMTTWRKLFALNIQEGKEGREYARYETVMSALTGSLGIIGGTIASLGEAYFDKVIAGAGVLIILSSIWPIFIYNHKDRKSKVENEQRN